MISRAIDLNLVDQTVLITGAAGLIGSSVPRQAVAAGANLVLVDIAREPLELLKNLKDSYSANIISIVSICLHR